MRTIPVRPGEGFDVAAVAVFLRRHLPDLPAGDLQVEQCATGASNLTYLLRLGDWQAVLRRPPLGPVAPRAHDVGRECRLLQRLHPAFPLAPRPYLCCDDPGLIGSPFFVMEARQGVVVDEALPGPWQGDPAVGRRISAALVDTLVQLHAVDYAAAGLGEIGHPEGYLQRQVQGWLGRWERAKTQDLPEVAAIARWLLERLPPSPPPTVVHNDFKLNNVMLDPTAPGRVTAVLDWEMSTVGDPLTDLGALAAYWREPGEAAELGEGQGAVTAQPGFFTRDELLERYARMSGRNLDGIEYYIAFSFFKIAVICQQIYCRWLAGQTRDERFARLGETAIALVRRAARSIGG